LPPPASTSSGTALGVDPDRIPVVTRDQVKYARPDPDLFLAAAERLNAPIETAVVVGDSIWDMLNSLQLSLNIFSIVPESLRSTLMNSFADERWPLVLRYSPSPSSQAKRWLTLCRRAAVGTREQKH
jgi:beta-phosphoglucomutase-like phosphatase (HAD superfamily)